MRGDIFVYRSEQNVSWHCLNQYSDYRCRRNSFPSVCHSDISVWWACVLAEDWFRNVIFISNCNDWSTVIGLLIEYSVNTVWLSLEYIAMPLPIYVRCGAYFLAAFCKWVCALVSKSCRPCHTSVFVIPCTYSHTFCMTNNTSQFGVVGCKYNAKNSCVFSSGRISMSWTSYLFDYVFTLCVHRGEMTNLCCVHITDQVYISRTSWCLHCAAKVFLIISATCDACLCWSSTNKKYRKFHEHYIMFVTEHCQFAWLEFLIRQQDSPRILHQFCFCVVCFLNLVKFVVCHCCMLNCFMILGGATLV